MNKKLSNQGQEANLTGDFAHPNKIVSAIHDFRGIISDKLILLAVKLAPKGRIKNNLIVLTFHHFSFCVQELKKSEKNKP